MLLENLLHLLGGWAPVFRQQRTRARAVALALARKTHKKASKAAPFFCKFLVLNKLNFTKRTPLR